MPDGFGLYTQDELIVELGKSRATITRWRKEGLPVFEVRKRRPMFDLKAVNRWLRSSGKTGEHGGDRTTPTIAAQGDADERTDEQIEELLKAGEGLLSKAELEALRVDHLRARIRKEKAMADRHELDVAKRRGELVEKADVELERIKRINYARAVLLGGPGILAGDIVGLGVEEIEGRLGAWVRQALGHLGPAS